MIVEAPARIGEGSRTALQIAGPANSRLWLKALLFLAWVATGIYVVPADQQAVVTRFGRIVEPRVMPGLHVTLPWPIGRVVKLKVRQTQRAVIGGSVADGVIGRSEPLESQFLTGDQNLIHIRSVAQYSISVPVDYLFQIDSVDTFLGNVVAAEIARSVARIGVDEILTTAKARLQEEVRGSAQRRLNDVRSGILIASVNIESVAPPAEAADAFRDVAGARADSSRIVNEAHGYRNDVLPRARGEAQQMREAAEGHKQRVMNQAIGDTERFRQVAAEYAKASQVNGRRLYLETLEQVIPRIRKVFVDSKSKADVTIVRKGE